MPELVRVSGCDKSERCGDVVFVHGLNGDPKDYWGVEGNHWPAWIGEELPNVGVWSLGYENAAFKNFPFPALNRFSLIHRFFPRGFAMPLIDRAKSVLLTFEVEKIGEKPLIFIAHSMGGLLVKQLLRAANEQPKRTPARNLLERTKGVCFIATPHIGSDMAKWMSYFGRLLGSSIAVSDLRGQVTALAVHPGDSTRRSPKLVNMTIKLLSHEVPMGKKPSRRAPS